jgi:hypothetical protein
MNRMLLRLYVLSRRAYLFFLIIPAPRLQQQQQKKNNEFFNLPATLNTTGEKEEESIFSSLK